MKRKFQMTLSQHSSKNDRKVDCSWKWKWNSQNASNFSRFVNLGNKISEANEFVCSLNFKCACKMEMEMKTKPTLLMIWKTKLNPTSLNLIPEALALYWPVTSGQWSDHYWPLLIPLITTLLEDWVWVACFTGYWALACNCWMLIAWRLGQSQ